MPLQVLRSEEIHAASVARSGSEFHLCCELRVRDLVLHRASGTERGLPRTHAARRQINMSAERALAGLGFSGETVDVIRQKLLRQIDVNLAFIFRHQLIPAPVARIAAEPCIISAEIGFLRSQLGIDGKIGAHEISVAFALKRDIFQTQFQAGDFAFVSISNQPVIGIAAVVTFLENARRIVDLAGAIAELEARG